MNANEFMIGDWVQYRDEFNEVTGPYEIDLISNDEIAFKGEWFARVFNNNIEPIPITAEILEKNGFVHYEEDEESFHDKDCVFIKQNLGEYGVCLDKIRTASGTFHYVHELQHALRLCGVEKEIKL